MTMHDYQRRALQFALEHPASYMAIDMGLGKTRIALEWIQALSRPTLVVAPVRVCMTSWPNEIKKWGFDINYATLHGDDKLRILKNLASYKAIFCPYSSLKWLFSALTSPNQKGLKWVNMNLVLDEATFVKSHSTKRFDWLKKMDMLLTNRRMALSATPAPQSLIDLWSQYYLLDKGQCLGKNISAFRKQYCQSFSYPGMPVTLYKVPEIYKQVIYDAVAPITFRLDAADYKDLPEVIYNFIPIALPAEATVKYHQLEQAMALQLDDQTAVFSENAASLSMKLRQVIQGGIYTYDDITLKRTGCHILHEAKLEALKEVIEAHPGKSILCAIQFRFELDMLKQAFPKAEVIAGGCDAKDAIRIMDSWNAGNIPLLICHPASISHGVNLQDGGHILIWYGLTWSLEQYIQLTGRLARQGQKYPVIVHHLIATDTIDEAVKAAIDAKASGQQKLLNYLKEYIHGKSNV